MGQTHEIIEPTDGELRKTASGDYEIFRDGHWYLFASSSNGLPCLTPASPDQGNWVADIKAMHTKFGEKNVVSQFDAEKLKKYLEFRLSLIAEEHKELLLAVQEKNADDTVDALIDLCVVSIGMLNAFDVDLYTAWDRVHGKNMQKEVGIKASRPNPLGLPDLIKPEGWTSPTHADNVGLFPKAFQDL